MVIDQFFPSQMVHFTQFFKVALNPHLGEMLPYFSIRGYSLAWKNVIMLFWIISSFDCHHIPVYASAFPQACEELQLISNINSNQ